MKPKCEKAASKGTVAGKPVGADAASYFLRLRNAIQSKGKKAENACFGNSLVQCLLSLDELRNCVTNATGRAGPLHQLRLLVASYESRAGRF